MTYDEIRNEIGAIRSGSITSDADSAMLAVLLELTEAVESLSLRVQEFARIQDGINTVVASSL